MLDRSPDGPVRNGSLVGGGSVNIIVRPSEMQLTTQQDCDLANASFNAFHDGFLRELRWQSPMRFAASMPWEAEKSFKTNEERLFATE